MTSGPGFVDIHSHVLYGLDDGAATIEESLAMLAIAEQSGTTDLVATPHANSEYPFAPGLIASRIAELQPRTSVRIHPGCDFHLHVSNIEDALQHPEKYTINHGNYLLVEFPEMSRFRAAGEIFRRLLEAGLVPIISHPERNEHLRSHEDDLAEWVQEGCYVQITAASVTGLFGPEAKRSAWRLFERRLAHIVASDAHNTRQRTPDLRAAYEALGGKFGEEAVDAAFSHNPGAVVMNDPFEVAIPATRATRKWYRFWS